HPRQPLPDTLTWESADVDHFNRAHWLIIDRFGAAKGDAKALSDLNDMAQPPSGDFGVRSAGMRINRVVPGSNADQMGVKPGDVLLRLNDQSVAASPDVAGALEDTPPGSKITLMVVRDNLPVELTGIYRPQIVETPPKHLFARTGTAGRVDITRSGNVITASTRGVAAFTLLLSPDQFDFGKPVKVDANGRTGCDGKGEERWQAVPEVRRLRHGRQVALGRGAEYKV